MKILLTGKNGQLGQELGRTLSNLGEITAVDFPEIDFCDQDGLLALLEKIRPDLIVNPAAYTQVDKAEEEEEKAFAANAGAVAVMGGYCAKNGIPILHYSTDYVFDGNSEKPYLETDAPNPAGAYGRTKLAGERLLAGSGAPHIILRTAWLYSLAGKSFLLTIKRLAREKTELKVVDDQIGCPTWARQLAETSSQILAMGLADPPSFFRRHQGIYHCVAAGRISWHGFARAIVRRLAGTQALSLKDESAVLPIKTSQYPTAAKRPAFSVMSTDKLFKTFGLRLAHWEEQLDQCLGC